MLSICSFNFPVFFLCIQCKNGYYKLSIQSNYKSTKRAFSMANAFCIILQQIWIPVDNTQLLFFLFFCLILMYKIVNFCPPSGVTSCPFDPILFFPCTNIWCVDQSYNSLSHLRMGRFRLQTHRQTEPNCCLRLISWWSGPLGFSSLFFLRVWWSWNAFVFPFLTATVKRVDNLYLPVKITPAA